MKLFRGMRQSLITEGNLKKYLLYAVGEILLVMIGISLAFQVSNWDSNRLKKNAENLYYDSVRAQIEDDKENIKGQKGYNKRYMTEYKYANKIIENDDRSKLDTLGPIIHNLLEYSDFDKQGNIYETMVNSGQINSLKNQKIVNGIRELEEMYIYINRMENIHYDAMMNHTAPVITSILKFSTREIEKPDVVFTYEFQNLILVLLQVMEEKDRTYDQAINEIDLISRLIDEELESR
tara:strand:- start:673 stop:1380 length:708 start_codon:yes stop_codon:yes gene_type:complete